LNLQRYEDVRDSSNNVLFHSDSVPVGHYWYNRAQVAFATSPGRTVSLMGSVGFGSYYTGSNTAADVVATVRVAPHLITQLEVSQDAVRLGPERFRARFARLRFDAAATPRLGGTVFLQYDNASDRLTLNARLHWLPAPGSDAYLVWNSGWDTALPGVSGIPWRRPAQGGLVAKFVYYVRL